MPTGLSLCSMEDVGKVVMGMIEKEDCKGDVAILVCSEGTKYLPKE